MSQPETGKRITSLDVLRGIAVILMVQQHTGYWFWNTKGSMASNMADHPVMVIINGFGGLAAPLFILLAGAGAALYLSAHSENKSIIARGVLVAALGYLLNVLTPAWFSPGSWYVLHLIGLGLCISPLLRKVPGFLIAALVILIMCLTPAVMAWLDMPRYYTNEAMRSFSGIRDIALLAAVAGNFPVLPWMSLFLMGFLSGRWLIDDKRRNIALMAGTLLASGLILLALKSASPAFLYNGYGIRLLNINLYMYPAYTLQFIALSAVSIAAVYLATAERLSEKFSEKGILAMTGRVSLTVFILHIVIIRNGMTLSGLWKSFSVHETACLQLLTLAVIALLIVLWKRSGFRYGFEWMIRSLSR